MTRWSPQPEAQMLHPTCNHHWIINSSLTGPIPQLYSHRQWYEHRHTPNIGLLPFLIPAVCLGPNRISHCHWATVRETHGMKWWRSERCCESTFCQAQQRVPYIASLNSILSFAVHIIFPILSMKARRLREVKYIAKTHASAEHAALWEPRPLTAEPCSCTGSRSQEKDASCPAPPYCQCPKLHTCHSIPCGSFRQRAQWHSMHFAFISQSLLAQWEIIYKLLS